MIPSLEEYDTVVLHDVDDPVLEAQPPGPDIRAEVLEGLRLSESREGVFDNVKNELEKRAKTQMEPFSFSLLFGRK